MFKIKFGSCIPTFDLLRSPNTFDGRYRRSFIAFVGANSRVRSVIQSLPNGNVDANDIRHFYKTVDVDFSDIAYALGTRDLSAMPKGCTECVVNRDERTLLFRSARQNLLKANASLNIALRCRTPTLKSVKDSSILLFWRQFFYDDLKIINATYT